MTDAREKPMSFPRRDRGKTRVIGKTVEFKDGRWQSSPIRIFVNSKALEARR